MTFPSSSSGEQDKHEFCKDRLLYESKLLCIHTEANDRDSYIKFIMLFFSNAQVVFLFEQNEFWSHNIMITCSATQNKTLPVSIFKKIYPRIYSKLNI